MQQENKQKVTTPKVVTNSDDPLINTVQAASFKSSGTYLRDEECKLFLKAIYSLKLFSDGKWAEKLSDVRLSYFFHPSLSKYKNEMIFVSYPLFMSDIIENLEINSYLHDPIVMMASPLAFYLFKEYPVNLVLDMNILRSKNRDVKFNDVGGITIIDGQNLDLEDAIINIKNNESMNKQAATEISRDVFAIDEIDKNLDPGSKLWDKETRSIVTVVSCDVGTTGNVTVSDKLDEIKIVPKLQFDQKFSIISL